MEFQELGYAVRSAQDGWAALSQIGQLVPDILLSDLNMPGMSGFELLPVVRRRFPAIRVVAMSGAFCGSEVPAGVVADAFYQKGSDRESLLKTIRGLSLSERKPPQQSTASAPLWVERSGSDAEGRSCASITCPECKGTFHPSVGGALSLIREARCAHRNSLVYYAIAEPVD